jgi:hypothetical protein
LCSHSFDLCISIFDKSSLKEEGRITLVRHLKKVKG